jgi:hypothetical protein
MKKLVIFLFGILLTACPSPSPKPDPTPTPDPSANVYEAACKNIGDLGCSEGKDDNCVETLQKTQEGGLVDMKPTCLANAKSVGDVQACGSVECVATSDSAVATCSTSCANLKKLGCKEGVDTTCVTTCQKMVAKKVAPVPLSCFAKAKTKAVARACGGIDCL